MVVFAILKVRGAIGRGSRHGESKMPQENFTAELTSRLSTRYS